VSDLTIDMPSPSSIELHFKKLTAPMYASHLLDIVGALVVSQTQRRIHEEKRAPDGTEWDDWSDAYAGHKHGAKGHEPHPGQLRNADGHSLLELFGNLLTSITHVVHDNEVEIGSNLAYAGAQNMTRPFLGLSDANESELDRLVSSYLETLL